MSCGRRRPDEIGHVLGIVARVFPDQLAVGGIECQHARARAHDVHDALGDDRHRLLSSRRHPARPHHLQLADIFPVDLVERAEALLIVGSIEHQPVARIRVGEHLARDRLEIGALGGKRQCGQKEHGNPKNHPDHRFLP